VVGEGFVRRGLRAPMVVFEGTLGLIQAIEERWSDSDHP
jgi:hypothetical protein